MPIPIANNDSKATSNFGNNAKSRAAKNASEKPTSVTIFSEYFSIRIPEGMDITPYATKNEKGKNPARPMLKSKLSIMSGISGPRMFDKKEITKKIRKISATIRLFLFMITICLQDRPAFGPGS